MQQLRCESNLQKRSQEDTASLFDFQILYKIALDS